MSDKKPMATKCRKAELELIQMRRRRATKVAELVEQMGVKCINDLAAHRKGEEV